MLERISLLVSIVLFALYSACIFMAMMISIPLGNELGIVLAILVSWFTLRLHPGWICVLLLSTTAWRFAFRGQPWEWDVSLFLSLIWCAIFSWRVHYNSIRLQTIRAFSSLITSTSGTNQQTGDSSDRLGQMEIVRALLAFAIWIGCGMILAIVAAMLLGNNPLGGGNRRWTSWVYESRQVLWPGPTLLILLLGVGIILREWGWRQKNRVQAVLWLRSESLRLQYSDLMRTVRLRRSLRAKSIAKKSIETQRGK